MNGWAASSDWQHVGGMLVNDGSNRGNEWISAPCRPATQDYAIEADIQLIDPVKCGFNIHEFGLIARAEEEGGILGGLDCRDANGVAIASTERGQFFFNKAIASKDFTLDQEWHVWRLEVQSNTVRLFLDGAPILEGTDNRHLGSGEIGMFSKEAQINVRSFRFTEL